MSITTNYADGTLTISRLYDAPRETVFEAWVLSSKVQQWWGCADTKKTVSDIDPCVGGKYNHLMTMHGSDQLSKSTIIEYDPPARLAYEAEATQMTSKMAITVDFTEEDGQTRVTLVHNNIPDEFNKFVVAGWTAAFGKLADFLLSDAA